MMTIKQRKVFIRLLQQHLVLIEEKGAKSVNSDWEGFFSRKELLAMIDFLYDNEHLKKYTLLNMENDELLKFIYSDYHVIRCVIHALQQGIVATPNISGKEINEFFTCIGMETHYLMYKPSFQWDEYDRSNYYSLLFKHGKTKKVYAIFTADVKEEDKYAVTTKYNFFFDTIKEAEEEVEKLMQEGQFKKGDLKIMSLWQWLNHS